jgi:Cu-Zn family superoxide dismutase
VEAVPAAPGDAVCVLQPASGSQVAGTVHFHQEDGALVVTASVSGLKPGAKHAIHIHEFGDLRAADATSAGGHFNPGGHQHGGPEAKEHHAGDLGNLKADGAGEAHYELRVPGLTTTAIAGRAVVVHASEDDLASQPAGNAGARIAVGVIGWAKPVE